MNWKLPTKVLEHRRAVYPSADTMADVKERFYDDYLEERNSGDSKFEVLTQLSKLPYPGASFSEIRAFQTMEEHNWDLYGVTGRKMTLGIKKPSPLPKLDAQELLGRSIKASAAPALKRWLENASNEEKEVVMRMLRSAESDDERVQTLLLSVLKTDMMPGVQSWLNTASETDKRVVLKLLQSVQEVKDFTAEATTRTIRPSSRQKRPVFARHAAPATYPQAKVSELPNFRGDDYNRWVHRVEKGKANAEYRTGKKYDQPFVLWNHRSKRDPTPTVTHLGSIFSMPSKPVGQHFAILPEWPIA
jgi:hypothetical protein